MKHLILEWEECLDTRQVSTVMVHWVYILECENNRIYVGETTRLFRRFWEHNGGRGGVNTCMFTPRNIVALYKVQTIGRFLRYNESVKDQLENLVSDEDYAYYRKQDLIFFDSDREGVYNHLAVENAIVHCLGMHKPDLWANIRGGKYIRPNQVFTRPNLPNLLELPLCDCGYPCDIKKNKEKNCLYFRCAKKNMWDSFRDVFDVMDEPCKFYKEYAEDLKFRKEIIKDKLAREEHYRKLISHSPWLRYVEEFDGEPCSICNKNDYNAVMYGGIVKQLCSSCFFSRHLEVETKYKERSRQAAIAMFDD